jgi:hypothetical protein
MISRIWLGSLLLLLFACREDIDWNVDDAAPKLVVEGVITNEIGNHYVALTRSQGYYDSGDPQPVTGATVVLSDGSTEYILIETEFFPGLYFSEMPFAGEVGKTYDLSITLDEPIQNNTIFTAQTIIQPSFKLDSIGYYLYDPPETSLFNYESRAYFTVFGHEPETLGNYYVIDVIKNDTSLTTNIDDKKVWDDRWFNGLNEVQTGDFGFFEPISKGDTLTLQISSIDRGYYDFVNNIKLEIRGKDPFGFIGPPSNVAGNISNDALGYFVGYAVSRESVIVK